MTSEQTTPNAEVIREKMGVRIVALLLLVASLSVFVLWTINPVGSGDETTFAIYLAVDLIAFALISYVRRRITDDGKFGRAPLIAGCCFILLLVLVDLYLRA